MYDEEGFKKFASKSIGQGSVSNYINGLKSIEKRYTKSLDDEFNKDKCISLLTSLETKKKGNNIPEKEKHKWRDRYSHLKKFVEFKESKQKNSSPISVYSDSLQNVNSEITKDNEVQKMNELSKNIILYGPPGTGKTYNSVNYAVAIIEEKDIATISTENYHDVLDRYNEYKDNGDIAFTTFHQSFGYEEFIEGIKPIIDNTSDDVSEIQYDVASGVFKDFCEHTKLAKLDLHNEDIGVNKSPTIWKVSLGGTGENPTRRDCLDNGYIRIGWDDYGEHITDETIFTDKGERVLNAFINTMQIGDIVVSCFSALLTDAIGVIIGEYEWHNELKHYKRLRKVKWLVKDIEYDITEVNDAKMTLSSVYKLKLTIFDIVKILKDQGVKDDNAKTKRYVFIIDEINRGNISKIFGELITLIEPSKRIGEKECIMTKLPYSKKLFGVPDNIYIIGTMNTADRSIAHIDTALRRRFDFVEMLPDSQALKNITVDGLNISNMLTQLNKKITALYDREHTIGHAYFIPLKENSTIGCLAGIFKNKIIPLLQEYFYEDYEKIRLVLGDSNKSETELQFVVKQNNDFAELFGETDYDFDDKPAYEINSPAFYTIESYKSI